ncbi:MAG: MFS transporter [Burkholderiaceae bacterium]|nr:MFS transporter [Burkholderiaceae bacterium]
MALPARTQSGTLEYRRTNRALFLGGFSTFSLLYCVQPLMPVFAREFNLTPVQSSWSLSISTGALAVSLVIASAISDAVGRKSLMCGALVLSALMTIACAFTGSYAQFLLMRGLLGVVLAGLPAVAMAYLSEEMDTSSLGFAMGLYIGGSALGGMLGRVVASILSEAWSWCGAMAAIGLFSLFAGIEFWRSLPASKRFHKTAFNPQAIATGLRSHLQNPGLPWLFLLAFLLMGCFVSLYNYMGFRLMQPQFGLRQSQISTIFSLYLSGIFSSVATGRMADKFGRRRVLWIAIGIMLSGLLLTLSNSLYLIVPGIALFTFGFFGSHSVASSWVGRRARAPQALASAMYLFCYYLGSSVVGSLAGHTWSSHGWTGIVLSLGLCLAVALAIAWHLRNLVPVKEDASASPLRATPDENPGV